MNKSKFFKSLLRSTDSKSIFDLLESNKEHFKKEFVDKDDNNEGGINIVGKGIDGFAERVTNMFNANLLFEAKASGKEKSLKGATPRQAIEELYNIPQGRLSNVWASKKVREDLREKSKVILEDSDRSSEPTVTFRDLGIGIKGSDFSKTILKLRGKSSRDISYLTGRYGMGGSTALSFSPYTLIVSKPAFNNKEGKTFFTVVMKEEFEHGFVWKYIVDKNTNQPFEVLTSDEDFMHGTLIKHVNFSFDFPKAYEYGRSNETNSGAKWAVNNKLWDMLLPIQVNDRREVAKSIKRTDGSLRLNMTSGGFKSVLENKKDLRSKNRFTCQIKNKGNYLPINVNYYVLPHEFLSDSKKSTNGIQNYVKKSEMCVLTLNGLKQASFDTQKIRSFTKLEALMNYLIIEVETDGLGPLTSRVFTAGRNELQTNDFVSDLFDIVASSIKSNDELIALNKEYFDYSIKSIDNDTIYDLLNSVLRKNLNNSGYGKETGKWGTQGTGQTIPEKDTMEYPEEPTFLKVNTIEKEISPNRGFRINVESDASSDVFDELLVVDMKGNSNIEFIGRTYYANGKTKLNFRANNRTQIGDKGVVQISLKGVDSDYFDFIAVDKKFDPNESSDTNKTKYREVHPRILHEDNPSDKEKYDQFFSYDPKNSCSASEGSIIYINGDNEIRLSFIKSIKNKYQSVAVRELFKNSFDTQCAASSYVLFDKIDNCFNENVVKVDTDSGKDFTDENFKVRLSESIPTSVKILFDMIQDSVRNEINELENLHA